MAMGRDTIPSENLTPTNTDPTNDFDDSSIVEAVTVVVAILITSHS